MSSGVTLFALGPIALAARTFSRRGERRLVVVAKATCDIVPDAPMSLAQPRPMVAAERYSNGPTSSVTHPGDLALRMPRAQLLVAGAVYTEGGRPAPTALVRLAVARGEAMLIDKRLEVVGARRGPARASGLGGAQLVEHATPFERLPLVYERAFGGPGFGRNPVGTGTLAGDDGLAALPNIHYANGRIAQDPAGFAAISSLWPARRDLLASTSRQAVDVDFDAQLTEDFADAYFLAAPSDQLLDAWTGGEMIALFQMHPNLPALRTYVPRLVGSARLQTARGVRVPIPIRIDTVFLDIERMSAELVFRGDIRVDDEAMRGARVGATVAEEGVELPDLASRGGGTPGDTFALGQGAGSPPVARRPRDATLVLPEQTSPERPASTPFRRRKAPAGTMVIEGSPPPAVVERSEPLPPRVRSKAETLVLEASDSSPPPAAAPLGARASLVEEESPLTEVMGGDRPRRPRASTVALEPDDRAPSTLPFNREHRAERPASAPPQQPLPGAPVSPLGSQPPPQAILQGAEPSWGLADEDTVVDDAPRPPTVAIPAHVLASPAPAGAPTPASTPAQSPAPPEAPSREEEPLRASPWREDPSPPPETPPAPQLPRVRVSFKSDLYRKFKK